MNKLRIRIIIAKYDNLSLITKPHYFWSNNITNSIGYYNKIKIQNLFIYV